MEVRNHSQLRVTGDLLLLEGEHDDVVLTHGSELRPLFINRGGGYVKTFLKAINELNSKPKILEAYPHEEALLNLLQNYRIVVPYGEQQRPAGTSCPDLKHAKKASISLYLLLSQSCNMQCVYCLNGEESYQKESFLKMSDQVALLAVDRFLGELTERGAIEFVFFGGEPMLNWPLAKTIIEYCEKKLREEHLGKKRHYHFTSSLSVLPGEIVELAKRYNITFLCDVDGPPEVHDRCRPFRGGRGTFQIIEKNIRTLRNAGLTVNLRATITALNQDFIMETTRIHKELGGTGSAFCMLNAVNSDEGILPEELLPDVDSAIAGLKQVLNSGVWKLSEIYPFNQLLSRFKPFPSMDTSCGCGAPLGNTPVLAVNGDVYPCIYLVGIQRFYLGNLLDGSYPKLEVLERMYEALRLDQRNDCRDCSWRRLCGGGCPLGELTIVGNPSSGDRIKEYSKRIRCDFNKSMLEALLWKKAEAVAGNHEV
jgi:uncharacterized protein